MRRVVVTVESSLPLPYRDKTIGSVSKETRWKAVLQWRLTLHVVVVETLRTNALFLSIEIFCS